MKFLLKKRLNKVVRLARQNILDINERIINEINAGNFEVVEELRRERELLRTFIRIAGGDLDD